MKTFKQLQEFKFSRKLDANVSQQQIMLMNSRFQVTFYRRLCHQLFSTSSDQFGRTTYCVCVPLQIEKRDADDILVVCDRLKLDVLIAEKIESKRNCEYLLTSHNTLSSKQSTFIKVVKVSKQPLEFTCKLQRSQSKCRIVFVEYKEIRCEFDTEN